MKIIVFSDIHGNQYALSAGMDLMEQEDAERMFFLGDVFGYYYGQNECLDMLRGLDGLTCLQGNHEKLFLKLLSGCGNESELVRKYGSSYRQITKITRGNIIFVKSWPEQMVMEIDGCRLGFFHGTPTAYTQGRLYPDTEIENQEVYAPYDAVFLGHTHHKMCRQCGSTLIYNPGSLGQQRDGQGCSYIVFDTSTGQCEWRIVPYGLEQLLLEIDYYDMGMKKLREPLLRQRGRWRLDG